MTQETKYTPGPWGYDDYDHTAFCSDKYKEDYFMRIEWSVDALGIPEEEIQANARLIAAAPELLEALEELIAMNNCNYDRTIQENGYKKARAAIAKARGK